MPNDNKAKWTIMIYMAADDAIGIPEAYRFLGELQELSLLFPAKNTEELEDSREIRVLLQAYTEWNEKKEPGSVIREAGFGPRRFELDSNFTLENWLNVDIENEDKGGTPFRMGSSKALFKFIEWCRKTAPAEKYMLFLWGHGTGSSMFSRNLEDSYAEMKKAIRSLSMTDLETGHPIKDIHELTRTDSPFFKNNKARVKVELQDKYHDYQSDKIIITRRETPNFYKEDSHFKSQQYLFDIERARNGRSVLSPAANNLRKYLSTRSSLDALLEKEIREALTEVENLKEPGREKPIDILLIMGCAMQMVEFAYEISPYCKYFIGSEELIYFHGYNYFDSFTALHDYPEMDAPTLAKRIVQEAPIKSTYTDFEKHSLAIACVDLAKNGNLAELIEKFAKNVIEQKYDKGLWLKIKKARKQCRHFGEDAYTYSFIDVAWFFKKFAPQVSGHDKYKELNKIAEEIIKLIEEQYIVQSWIGKKRTPTISTSQYRSFGGHGVGIYFPESVKAHADNADLKVFFEKGHPLENKFTKNNDYWYKMVLMYREVYGEESSYPLTDNPAPEDPALKKLREQLQTTRESLADQLMENDKIMTGAIADELLEKFKRPSGDIAKAHDIVVDLLLSIENLKRGPLADILLADYTNSNTPVKTEA